MVGVNRTQRASGLDALESESFEFGDMELYGGEAESPFNEVEEMELTAELLAVSNEAELDQFLGSLFKKAWKGIKGVGRVVGKIAKPLGGVLKGIAKTALPFVGGALGSFIPIPGVGTAVGTALGSAVSNALEAELEGMNEEDQEFEMARRFVRIAGTSAQHAAQGQPDAEPQAAVEAALMTALRQHLPHLQQMPGLFESEVEAMAAPAAPPYGASRSGRWVRRGRELIVIGA